MKIPEKEFHRALLAYFEKLHREVGNVGWTADNIKKVTKELRQLVFMDGKDLAREKVVVNIGRTYGLFRFEIN